MEALLYLEDGTVIFGKGFGFKTTKVGELVFNTGMTGYQKTLTDPSYKGQIITMTYPLMGNYGISTKDNESESIHAFGLVAKDVCFTPSNSNCIMNIDEWLKEQKIPGIWRVDTRRITKKIRNEGTIKCLISNEGITIEQAKQICEETQLRDDWMKDVTIKEKKVIPAPEGMDVKKVAVLDFGVKNSILNGLTSRGCELHMFPYGTEAEEIMSINPDGIFLTNGPGDPDAATKAIEITKEIMGAVPTFGICMGHQILALASGGKTYKLKYGHRGANHGVYDKDTNRSYITSQNHGYAVDSNSIILKGLEVSHINLNDGTVEGMKHRNLPIFSVQYHPEASPGPNDSEYLFDRFIDMMKRGVL